MIFFGDPVHSAILSNEDNNRLIDNVKILSEEGFESYNPWECDVSTTWQLFNIFDIENFKWLDILLREQIKIYLKDINIDHINVDECHIDGWLNFYNEKQYQEIHDHAGIGAILSGSLLINCDKDGKNAGSFAFYNKNATDIKYANLMSKNKDSKTLCQSWIFDPEPGHLLIFPSYLPHFVTQNNTKTTRISLSFNLVPYK